MESNTGNSIPHAVTFCYVILQILLILLIGPFLQGSIYIIEIDRILATSPWRLYENIKGTTPYCVKTVAVLNSWGAAARGAATWSTMRCTRSRITAMRA